MENENDLHRALNIVDTFSKVSGLKLNLNKTEGIRLGNMKDKKTKFKEISWAKSPVRCLGIYVGIDKDECTKLNWMNKLEEIQKLLDSWRTRDLTLFGKILVIKSLAISKIVFSAMNTEIPDNIDKLLNKVLYNFIWNKRDRIKRNVMIAPIPCGGINMIDIKSFFKSLKASWVKRIIEAKQATWNIFGKEYFKTFGENDLILKMSFSDINQFELCQALPTL